MFPNQCTGKIKLHETFRYYVFVCRGLDYIASPGIVIPLLLLLVLIIYYLVSLTGALREANNDLKVRDLGANRQNAQYIFCLDSIKTRAYRGKTENVPTGRSQKKRWIWRIGGSNSIFKMEKNSRKFTKHSKLRRYPSRI